VFFSAKLPCYLKLQYFPFPGIHSKGEDRLNKYEMVLVAAREARRLNDVAKIAGRDLRVRPTIVSWERLHQGKIKFTYEPESSEEEARIQEGA